MIDFNREPAHLCFKEAMPLIVEYRREINYYTDLELKPGFDAYERLEKSGAIRAFTARKDGKLIGFALFLFYPHMHFNQHIFAMHDILYIDPKHRGFGYKFLKWCSERLKEEGAKVIYVSVNLNFDFSPILKRLGFEIAEHIYTRRL